MTIAAVWGRIQGGDAFPVSVSGNDWIFPVPRNVTGRFVSEFWARDEAGNTTYRYALLEIEQGMLKCFRLIKTSDRARMLPIQRQKAEMLEVQRPIASMLAHKCPAVEV